MAGFVETDTESMRCRRCDAESERSAAQL